MAPIVTIDPEVSRYPILDEAGLYGSGMQHEADVELTRFEWPAAERLPAFDRENERGPYAYFGFVVTSETKGKVFYDHWEPIGKNSGSKAPQIMLDLGVTTSDNPSFDSETVAPRKVAAIEVTAPRKGDDGRMFNGRLVRVIG
jgi:hypothetical protein